PRLEGPVFTYPLSLHLPEAITAPRAALLGDAAHGVHPVAGQGLNLGLKDAAALVQVLVEAVRLGEDIGSEVVLDRYARWRSVDNIGLAVAADGFVRLFSNDNPILRAVRGLGLSTVNRIGPARRFFMQEAGGAVGDLPRLLRGEAP
ncbi:MAG: FAD-dependent monooxygenase, partial [Phenylobacterium sp.]|nr:FAD-dependent monooxygenase [Phenylobacterium sp.]